MTIDFDSNVLLFNMGILDVEEAGDAVITVSDSAALQEAEECLVLYIH
jgi:hypothetical protein